MFLSWGGFTERLTQIFGDPKAITIAEQKLQNIVQRTLVIKYTT